MTTRDLYADARAVADRLAAQGDRATAQRLQDAIEAGPTSSEILFGVRHVLDDLLRAPASGSPLRDEIEELRDAIDTALG